VPVRLADDEVHVWCATLEHAPVDLAELTRPLSAEERVRASRVRCPQARTEFLAARSLLRVLLAVYLDTDAARIAFRQGPQGKPLLEGTSLHFNVAHSHGLALFALSECCEVGVDLERLRPFPNHLGVAERFFSAREVRALRALAPPLRTEAFFHAWARKEAWLKANGLGLAHGLDRVEVTFPPEEPPRVLRIDGQERLAAPWSLHGLTPATGYVGAIAWHDADCRLVCRHWRGPP
jgi:4'-phosphopantetheinyl transferase